MQRYKKTSKYANNYIIILLYKEIFISLQSYSKQYLNKHIII